MDLLLEAELGWGDNDVRPFKKANKAWIQNYLKDAKQQKNQGIRVFGRSEEEKKQLRNEKLAEKRERKQREKNKKKRASKKTLATGTAILRRSRRV